MPSLKCTLAVQVRLLGRQLHKEPEVRKEVKAGDKYKTVSELSGRSANWRSGSCR